MLKSRMKYLLVIAAVMVLVVSILGGCAGAKKKVNVEKPEDLKGLKVGVQVSTTAHDSCIEYKKTIDFDLQTYNEVIQPFSELKTGRIDAVVVDEVVARDYVKKDPKNFKIAGARLTNEPIAICFKKDNSAMRDKVDQILDELRNDGTLKSISEKWFGEDLTAGVVSGNADVTVDGNPFEGKTKLVVGVDDVYPPMEYRDESNKTVGFDIDLGNEIGKRLGLEVEFISTAWDGIFTSLNTDKFDCIISSISITEERQQNFALTRAYLANAQVIVVRP